MCGTAAEVTPIRSVDDHEIGEPGPITKEIQQAYWDTFAAASRSGPTGSTTTTRTPAQA